MFVFHCFNSSPGEDPFPIVVMCISTILFNSHYLFELMTYIYIFHLLDGYRAVNIFKKILSTTLFQIAFACVANRHKCSNIMLQFDELSSKKGIYEIIFPFKNIVSPFDKFSQKKHYLQPCHPCKSTLIHLHFDNTFYVIMTVIHWCLPKLFWLFGRLTRFKDFDMYGCN
jgi:hypothetical protein